MSDLSKRAADARERAKVTGETPAEDVHEDTLAKAKFQDVSPIAKAAAKAKAAREAKEKADAAAAKKGKK